VLDGPAIDDGTACEIGMFYALIRGDPQKKGIVGLVTDLRATREAEREGEARGLNLFVAGSIDAAGQIWPVSSVRRGPLRASAARRA